MSSEKEKTTNTLLQSEEKGDYFVEHEEHKRQTWSSQLDFVMTAIGGAVGLGNIWRFPYLCYSNGGGAFLVPYLISFILISAPTYIMEISLGQYMSTGCIDAWEIAPVFKGIGWCTAVIQFFGNIYYIIVIAWALYYLYMSLAAEVPWASCGNPWNSDRCFVTGMNLSRTALVCTNTTDSNLTAGNCSSSAIDAGPRVDAVVEFWERNILHQSSGIEEPGSLVPGLTVCLLLAWIVVYICLFKGVKWTGKIVYFTAIFPYVLLTILLIRGVTLDGAVDGIIFYVKPDFTKLGEGKVWIEAASQVLFSCGAGLGFMVSIGSYNKYNTNTFRNGLFIVCVNYFTSIFGGFCVFSILGFMAKELGQPIEKVVSAGPGLVFLAYPKAITQLPLSSLWAALFFILIIFVGLDSQFVGVEGLIGPIMDLFPRTLYKPRNRMLFLGAYATMSFLLGLTMVTEGGVYVFKFIDYYAVTGLVLLITVFFEALAIGWAFGADRYYDALELMCGRKFEPYMKICWKYIVPVATLTIFSFQLIGFKPLQFDEKYQYPSWVSVAGILVILSSVICIPATMVYRILRAKGSLRQRWQQLLVPTLKKHQIHPRWYSGNYRWLQADYNSYDACNTYDVDTKI